jgi:hypothetical protein
MRGSIGSMKHGWLTVVAVAVAAAVQTPRGSLAGDPVGAPPPPVDAKAAAPAGDHPGGPSGESAEPPKAPPENSPKTEKAPPESSPKAAKVSPERRKRDLEFKKASAEFPGFCKHWEENLRDRERDNLKKLVFALVDGLHTATFTGYGEVKICEAHQSKDGFSIGKITYEEFTYSVSGKTPEEAAKGEKKPVSNTITTEIFRWEKNKWFY